MRELRTIGSLATTRSTRAIARTSRRAYLGGLGSLRTDAALAMNTALQAHGYNVADEPLYKAYQQAAGLTVDGFPGTSTMMAWANDVVAGGGEPADVKVYPWLGPGKPGGGVYDGINAPPASEWLAGTPAASSAITVLPTTTITGSASKFPTWAAWTLAILAAGGAAYGVHRAMKKRGKKHARAGNVVSIFAA